MTASYRGPDYPLDANARRIDLLRRVTARSLSTQQGEWTWIVYVNPSDPLLDERLDAFRSAGAPIIAVENNDGAEAAIDWSGPVLTTRIDDDDAFACGAFDRLHRALAHPPAVPTAYIFPIGWFVRAGLTDTHRHLRNAWSSVYAPSGSREHIRLHQHQRVPAAYPVRVLDDRPGWLRVSHADNGRPTSHRGKHPITPGLRATFAVDWPFVEALA